MATDGILEVDLSGTDVIAYSGVGDWPAPRSSASATRPGRRLLRPADRRRLPISTATAAPASATTPRNSRTSPARSPSAATCFAASTRCATRISSTPRSTTTTSMATIEVQAGLGYNWQDNDTSIWGGSASALHTPTGLNLHARRRQAGRRRTRTGNFWYAKLGLLRELYRRRRRHRDVDRLLFRRRHLSAGASGLRRNGDPVSTTGIPIGTSPARRALLGLALVQNIDARQHRALAHLAQLRLFRRLRELRGRQAIFGGARFQF